MCVFYLVFSTDFSNFFTHCHFRLSLILCRFATAHYSLCAQISIPFRLGCFAVDPIFRLAFLSRTANHRSVCTGFACAHFNSRTFSPFFGAWEDTRTHTHPQTHIRMNLSSASTCVLPAYANLRCRQSSQEFKSASSFYLNSISF